MLYKITGVIAKTNDWKLVTGTGVDGSTINDASANRVDKSNKTWELFDQIIEGGQIEADVWKNPAGKQYIFAPKPATPKGQGNAYKTKQIEEVQNRTKEHVKEAQENRTYGIMVAAAMRDAVQLAIAENKDTGLISEDQLKASVLMYRDWYLKTWRETEKLADQPF